MDNHAISVKEILKELGTSGFIMNCRMPMGYAAGFPILQIKNQSLCLLVPYFKVRTTGEVDKTQVFPIRYTVTLELPKGAVVKYEDLSFHPAFGKIDFSKPVGYFRHDSIKQYNKRQYAEKKEELLSFYDKVINALLFGTEYTKADEEELRRLLQIMLEPSLLPQYRALDKDFYHKYLE